MDDRELIASAQLGDRQAFGELVSRHREHVVDVTYRMCGDVRLAEDAAQEAFIVAFEKLWQLQQPAAQELHGHWCRPRRGARPGAHAAHRATPRTLVKTGAREKVESRP